METQEIISSLRHNKSIVHNTLRKAFNNVGNLEQKLRQIEHIIDAPANKQDKVCNMRDKIKMDLKEINSVALQINNIFEKNDYKFVLSETLVNENKYIQYPQYPLPDLKPFVPGTRIKAPISYVINNTTGVFYVVDSNKSVAFSSIYTMLANKNDLTRIPDSNKLEVGELIGVVVDGEMARALVLQTGMDFSFFLIDMGDEVAQDEITEMYDMPNYYKSLPALGLLCKVKDASEKVRKYLVQNLYDEVDLEVVSVEYNTIYVKIDDSYLTDISSNESPLKDDSFISCKSESTIETVVSKYSSTNPFVDDVDKGMKTSEKNILNKSQQISETSTNPFLDDTNKDLKITDKKVEQRTKNDDINEFLKDCPGTGTSNAMVAVLGYDPKDEGKYCKFYDEKTGGCFKGVNCQLVHQKPLEDGWTRDQCSAWVNIPAQLPVPDIGQKIKIEMCYCEDIHLFYGLILNPEFHRPGAMTLTQLNRVINNPDHMKKYKRFTNVLPSKGELVIAPYSGSYYRARVIEVDEETADVFFVDYGNHSNVRINELCAWEKTFGEIPFQAVLFKVAGIVPQKAKPQPKRAYELHHILEGKVLIGSVLQNSPDILVRLIFESNNFEVHYLLAATGFANLQDNLGFQKKPTIVPMI